MKIFQCGSYAIPILDDGQMLTAQYLLDLAKAIGSDGCTCVSELYHECCVIHDLGYSFGIDPWGRKVSKRTIDASFRRGMQERSRLGVFSPVAATRWLGVAIFGGLFRKPKCKGE